MARRCRPLVIDGKVLGTMTVDVRSRPCSSCGAHLDSDRGFLCDFPVVVKRRKSRTCDRFCCGKCRVSVGENHDMCPPQRAALRRAPAEPEALLMSRELARRGRDAIEVQDVGEQLRPPPCPRCGSSMVVDSFSVVLGREPWEQFSTMRGSGRTPGFVPPEWEAVVICSGRGQHRFDVRGVAMEAQEAPELPSGVRLHGLRVLDLVWHQ